MAQTTCTLGGCLNPAVVRAWFARPCGHVEHVTPVCMDHPWHADRPTACTQCGDVSRLRITKRKRLRS